MLKSYAGKDDGGGSDDGRVVEQCTMRTLESRVEPYAKKSRIYTEAPRHLRHLPTRLLGIIYKFVYTIQRHI